MANTLKAVLAGCGAMSRRWLEAVQAMPDVEIVGLVDVVEAAAAARAAEFGLERAVLGTGIDEVLDRARPDMVFDVTVPEAHAVVSLAALERGCHVLSEKPLADSMAHARLLMDAAARSGRLYAVIQNRRYLAEIRRLRRLVASGGIGRLTQLHADFFIGPHFGGFREQMGHVLLLDMAIHTFDAARLITGADPVSVWCREWNPANSWYRDGASALAVFEMTGGIVYTYRGSWCAEGLPTSWEGSWRAVGEAGTALWDGGTELRAERPAGGDGLLRDTEAVPVPPLGPDDRVGGHAGLIREFVDCVRSGATPETAAADNIRSLAMVFAAIESAETGRAVDIAW